MAQRQKRPANNGAPGEWIHQRRNQRNTNVYTRIYSCFAPTSTKFANYEEMMDTLDARGRSPKIITKDYECERTYSARTIHGAIRRTRECRDFIYFQRKGPETYGRPDVLL